MLLAMLKRPRKRRWLPTHRGTCHNIIINNSSNSNNSSQNSNNSNNNSTTKLALVVETEMRPGPPSQCEQSWSPSRRLQDVTQMVVASDAEHLCSGDRGRSRGGQGGVHTRDDGVGASASSRVEIEAPP
jgi:hypothetical protein